MSSYNKVILMGNLTRDPEIRYTQNNMPICKFGLAVNRRFKDGQTGEWREEPTFVDITFFGKRGEAFAKYHTKGKPAFVEGSLRLDNWQDQDGNKRSKLYVVGDDWQFVGGGGRSEGGYSGGGGGGDYEERRGYGDSMGAGGGSGYGGGGGGQAGGGGGGGFDVEDTPF